MKWNKQLFAATVLLANSVSLPIVAIAENNSVIHSYEMIEKEGKQEETSKNEVTGERQTSKSSFENSKEAAAQPEIPTTPGAIRTVEDEEKAPESGNTNTEVETDAGTTNDQKVGFAEWETEDKGSYILITKYTGTSSDIVVPNEINDKPTKLKDIDSTVFPNLSSATSFKVLPREDGTKVGVESTDLSNAFKDKTSLKTIDLTGLDTSNVKNMAYMFYNCNTLTSLNVKGWNTSNVANMAYTFAYLKSLQELDVSTLDTGNVTTMEAMFFGCQSLPNIDVSSFNTSKVTNVKYMFKDMPKLLCLDLRNFELSYDIMNYSGLFDAYTAGLESAVIASDPKFFGRSGWASGRIAFEYPKFYANGGEFKDGSSSKRYINKFVNKPEEFDNTLDQFEQFKQENIPTKKGSKFLGWKLIEGDDTNATNVIPDLHGVRYQAQWADASVKVKYVFEDTGKEIASSKTIEGEVGESYDAT
ncbi:TPA: BspA family leucine-rich repeat surface protein, partial [Enterococcus faecium]